MKLRRTFYLMSVLTLFFAIGANAETARLQVIHNAADPAAETVDVYVNEVLTLDEFKFRTATPFIDVPAGVELRIGVAPGGDSTVDDIIPPKFPVKLEAGETYVAIANGVLNPTMFAPNPSGAEIGFTIFPRANIREKSFYRRFVNLTVFHGATDAPKVDVLIRGSWSWWGPWVNNLKYGKFSGYRTVYPKKYVLDVTPANDNHTVVASFEADLSGLRGAAAVVFASGFLTPDVDKGQAAFGLYAALPDGNVVPLPPLMKKARLQVVHNAADPAAAVVDVYLNGERLLDDFEFRKATPFVDVPAGVNLNIGVAAGNSASVDDVIKDFDVTLEDGKTYVAFANGVLAPDSFATNPDGNDTFFTLFTRDRIKEKTNNYYLVNLIGFHGATDAPEVDIVVNGPWHRWVFYNNLEYGDFSGYRRLLPRKYILDVTPSNDNNTIVASFEADLRGLRGGSAIVFASGFLAPVANQNGPAFGLFAVLPDGTVAPLPAVDNRKFALGDGPLRTAPEPVEARTTLGQNFPNPFNPQTSISFELATSVPVSLQVFNARGQLVETLISRNLDAGPYSVNFDAGRLASGVYFYRLDAGTFSEVRKMVLVK